MTDTPLRIEGMSELEQRLRMSKRRFVQLLLGSAAAYSVPLIASFSLEGLGVGRAHAQSGEIFPPGLFRGSNQSFQNFEQNVLDQDRFPFFGTNQTPGGANPPGLLNPL